MRPAKTWKPVVGATIVLGVALLGYVFFAAPADPIYNGLRLSQHLDRLYRERPLPRGPFTPAQMAQINAERETIRRTQEESWRVLANIGPETIPLLCDWLRSQTPPWRKVVLWARQKFKVTVPITQLDRGFAAAMAINQFQLTDRRFISLLRARISSGQMSGIEPAATALARNIQTFVLSQEEREKLVKEMIAGLASARTNSASRFQSWDHLIERCISLCDLDASLRNLIMLEVGTPGFKIGATMYFLDRPIMAERVVPLLVANLKSTNATLLEYSAKSLQAYGETAFSARPALAKVARHPKKRVAAAASAALDGIPAR